MGCDAIRTSHNMPTPELVALCDEMGFMMMIEPFDEWDIAKCENGYPRYFNEWAERDMVNMLHNYRNNPCVVMWSIGNEVPTQCSPVGYKVAKFLQDICHREDPTRPVTCGMDQVTCVLANGFAAMIDIPGLNYRANRYQEAYDKLPQNLILGSETASTVSSRGVYKFPVKDKKSAQYDDHQCSSYDVEACSWSNIPDEDFALADDHHWTIGQFVWTGFDYLGEPSPYDTDAWPNHSSMFGIIDLASLPKDRYYLYRSIWNKEAETLHILPHWTWPGREGEVTPVFVYTNYPAAELFINGKTAELCVREKAGDRRWYSTPQEGEGRQALLAQIELRYANSKSQISTMNSYADAVELGQFVWEACEGGVRVVYDIGKRKKVYTMPTVITKTRFEQVLLAGLSETDRTTVRGFYTAYSLSSASSQVVREELISKYPRIQDDDVYVLMDGLADFAAARLEAVIVSGGYTQEELEKDNAENQVAAPEASITFRVPVEYTLDKDGFVARVVTEDIQCPSSAHLLTLSLLPYFGAAGEKEEGYMLVPDGSGALIRLNNGKASQGLYQACLYGDNLTAGRSDVLTEKQAVPLPVYGMRRQTAGFLAIIESGDALAAVNAAVSGGANRFNYVYPSFTLNQAEAADVPYYMATSMYFYQKTMTREDLQVRYCFLNGEGSTYSGMARRYQQYLLDAGALRLRPEAKPALYLSLLGAIDYEDDIVGIPVQKTVALTTFDQARGIVEQLREQGVDSVAVLYEGWANGGLRHSAMDSLKVQKQLGGSKGMAAFEEYMQQNGDRVYWDIDLQYVHRNGLFDGYKAMSDAPKSIMGCLLYTSPSPRD